MLNFVLRLYFSSTYRITVELLRYGFYIHEHLDVFITVLALFITTSTATVYTRYTCCLKPPVQYNSINRPAYKYHSSGYVDKAAGLGGVGTAS